MKNCTGVIRHRFKKLHLYLARTAGHTETGRWAPTVPPMQQVPMGARAREVFEAVRRQVPFVHDVGTMQARLSFLFSDEGCEAHVAIPPRSPDAMPHMDYKALEERVRKQLQGLTEKKVTVVLDEAHNLLALKKGG